MRAYLYCTKNPAMGHLHYQGGGKWGVTDQKDGSYNGMIVAECDIVAIERWKTFEADKDDDIDGVPYTITYRGAVKDIGYGRFASDRAEREELTESSCVSMKGIISYAGGIGKTFYAWRLKGIELHADRLGPGESAPQSWRYFRDGVLLSIRPAFLALILNGEKTTEIRKSRFKKERK